MATAWMLLLPMLTPVHAQPSARPVAVTTTAEQSYEFALASKGDSRHLAVGVMLIRGPSPGDYGCAVAVSDNGGRSWTRSNAFPATHSGSGVSVDGGHSYLGPATGNRGGDPWVAYDAQGQLLASCFSGDDAHAYLSTSRDDGRHWTTPEQVPTRPGAVSDKPVVHVAAGRTMVCQNESNLTGAVSEYATAITLRSGRAPWRDARMHGSEHFLCNGFVGSGPKVWAVGARFKSTEGTDSLVPSVLHSADGGSSWSRAEDLGVMAVAHNGTEGYTDERPRPMEPAIASDPHQRRLFVAFDSIEPAPHIELRSADGQGRFSLLAPPAAPPGLCQQQRVHPNMAVTDDGWLALQYVCKATGRYEYDGREVWVTWRSPQGRWGKPLLLERTPILGSNMAPAYTVHSPTLWEQGAVEGGDYWQLTAAGAVVIAGWTSLANGVPQLLVQRLAPPR